MKGPESRLYGPENLKYFQEQSAETDRRVAFYFEHPEEIDERLREIKKEWDIERKLQCLSSFLIVVGSALAGFGSLWFVLVPAILGVLLFLHALYGQAPPMFILQRLKARTKDEIDREKFALKILRGDFDHLPRHGGKPLVKVLNAVND